MRANPHHITTALRQLERSEHIQVIDTVSAGGGRQLTDLYALSTWNPNSQESIDRLHRVKEAYEEYLHIAQNETHGKSLEAMIESVIQHSDQFKSFSETGRAPPPGTTHAGVRLPDERPLDHYLIHLSPPGIEIGVEDKDLRGWIYPSSNEMRGLLGTCQSLNMLPVLITRKVHYSTRLFCSYVGAIAFQTHNQCIPTQYAERLADARHKDGLGFADIRFTDEPPPHVTKLFSDYLPRLVAPTWEKFKNNKDIIKAYADREINYHELIIELGIVPDYEDQNEDFYDELGRANGPLR